MSYQALYRVYRPQTFAALIGQDAISQTLLNALRFNRLAHAYLFCGPRGTGKTSTSKILAKAVNCLDPQDGEPCNHCENCRAINEDRFLDVIEIDAASNRGIDEIRTIREQVRFTPSMGKRKVYIIDEVHMLTTEAFNALLKTLEEPPEHVLFILATTDPQKVPKTVLSRTQRFDFHRIPTPVLMQHLQEIAEEENIAIAEDALAIIAKSAAGGMRDAISLLDQTIAFAGNNIDKTTVLQIIGGLDDATLIHLVDCLISGDTAGLFAIVEKALCEGSDARSLMHALLNHLRDLLMLQVGHGDHPSEAMVQQAKALSLRQIEQLLKKVADAERDLRIAPDGELVLELTLVEMALLLHNDTPAATVPTQRAHLPRAGSVHAPSAAPTSTPDTAPAPVSTSTEAPSAATSARQNDSATLEAIKDVWPQVLEAIKDISIRIHAFVRPAVLQSYAEDTLTLVFPKSAIFNCKQMKLNDNKTVLIDTLGKYFPHPVKIECMLEEDEPKEPSIDLIEGIHQVFGADVPVEIIDTPTKKY